MDQVQLFNALVEAHRLSAFRDNISTSVIQAAMVGSGNYIQAVAAGILTLGNLHGPVVQTYDLLSSTDPKIDTNKLVPGWGGSYQKNGIDPLWKPVHDLLPENMRLKLDLITSILHAAGKKIWPNPSAYTASVAICCGIPREISPHLLIVGRLDAWAEIARRAIDGRKMLEAA